MLECNAFDLYSFLLREKERQRDRQREAETLGRHPLMFLFKLSD